MTGDALLSFINDKLFPTLKGIEVTRETPRSKAIVKEVFEDLNQYMKNGTPAASGYQCHQRDRV